MSNNKNSNDADSAANTLWLVGGVVFILVIAIGSCSDTAPPVSHVPTPVNDYQDMRTRGHSEEDAIIFSILKQQGYSDYDAVRAMQSSKEKVR